MTRAEDLVRVMSLSLLELGLSETNPPSCVVPLRGAGLVE